MRATLACLVLLAVACGNEPPSIRELKPQKATVGVAFEVSISAEDPDDESLTWSLKDPSPKGATLSGGGKQAVFRWVPSANQLGSHEIILLATDGTNTAERRLEVEVAADENKAKPVFKSSAFRFLEPEDKALDFVIEVQDDSPFIVFDEQSPINGASIDPPPASENSTKRARFYWEPTPTQRTQADWIYVIQATNSFGLTEKQSVKIKIRSATQPSTEACPGTPPTVAIIGEPGSALDTSGNYPVSTTLADVDTVIASGTLSWAIGENPTVLNDVSMTLQSTVWKASIPAPAIGTGDIRLISYKVCAYDSDGADTIECTPRRTCSELATFTAVGKGGLCGLCGADADCGAGNLCATGVGGERFCGKSSASGCPRGYVSRSTGFASPQCVPYLCAGGMTAAGCSCKFPLPGELVVNEVMPIPRDGAGAVLDVNGDGVASLVQDEFVEIVNGTDRRLTLTGVTLRDAQTELFAFATGAALEPGQAAVVFGGGSPEPIGAALVATGTRALDLSDTTLETLRLYDGRTELDKVSFTSLSTQRESYNRKNDGGTDVPMVKHTTLDASRLSPGKQVCGSPYPKRSYPCGGPACAVTDSDVEPNDDRPAAACLTASVAGKLALAFPECAATGRDLQDYFSFEGVAGKSLLTKTTPRADPLDIYDTIIEVYSPGGQLIGFGDDCGACTISDPVKLYSTVQVPLAESGTYYIVVKGGDAADCDGGYTLTAELK